MGGKRDSLSVNRYLVISLEVVTPARKSIATQDKYTLPVKTYEKVSEAKNARRNTSGLESWNDHHGRVLFPTTEPDFPRAVKEMPKGTRNMSQRALRIRQPQLPGVKCYGKCPALCLLKIDARLTMNEVWKDHCPNSRSDSQ